MDGSTHRNRKTPARALLTGLLALLLCGVLAGAAQATLTEAPFDGTSFQAGDGNQAVPDPNPDGLRDWESLANVVGIVDVDEDNPVAGFTGGSKETEPGAWELTDIGSPPKDDILSAWATTEVVNGHTILYMAFRRLAPNGNTFLTFELNQRTETWDNDDDDSTPEIPCREDGDVLISYEVEPGGTTEPDPVTIRLFFWVEDAEDPVTGCSTLGHFDGGDVLNDPDLANPLAQAAINEDGDIQNFLDTDGDGVFDGDDIQEFEQGTFGEAAIDVSAVFEAIGQPCFDFGQIQLHSRASSEISSELKDFAGPLDVPVESCVASGTKFEDLDADGAPREAGEPGLAGWIVFADYDGDGELDLNEPSDVTDAQGNYVVSDLTQEYTLRELPGPLVTGDWICSYPNDASTPDGSGSLDDSDFPCGWGPIDPNVTQTVQRDFGNYRQAKIIVEKQTVPDGAEGSFPFSGDLGVFSLSDDGTLTTFVDPGTYTATEGTTDGFVLTDITCSGDTIAPFSSDAGATATFNAQSGETITCVFTNTQDAKVTIVKDAQPDDAQDFAFTTTGAGWSGFALDDDSDATLPSSRTFTFPAGSFGAKTVTESPVEDWVNTGLECSEGDVDGSTATLQVDAGDQITCTFTNALAAIDVVKKIRNVTLGGQFVHTPPDIDAYVGDTLEYQFTVTNPGKVALDVAVVDPRCDADPTRTDPDDDANELLDPGETWIYVCSHVVTAADPDPLPNTVTATGTVPETTTKVEDKDSAEADIFHPAIDIEKTGPATATAGDVLNYTLAVTNPGDIRFASDKVVVTDPGCDDQPTLTSKNGDATPDFLDPGDNWTYKCSHLTAAGQSSYLNTAKVTGTDRNGREVSDTDELPTALGQVLPQPEIVSGAARLRGPSGCVKGPFQATVRGSRIARVTFFVDGKRFKRLTAPNGEGTRFTVSINPRGRGFGVHRVTARVEFAAASQTKARTLRLSFQRCKRQVVKPRFTG
jgi:hypothetical protein